MPVEGSAAILVSSGRGVHEAKKAARVLAERGVKTGVIDMPSVDETRLLGLYDSGRPVVVAEQNNGYIWARLMKTLFTNRHSIDTSRLHAVNTLAEKG